MFDLIRRNNRLRYSLVVLVTIPLAFVGGNFLVGGTDAAIRVGSTELDRERFERGRARMLENLREQGIDVDNLTPELQQAATDNFVSETISQLLQVEAVKRKSLVATDEEVRRMIAGMEEFREDGAFSVDLFDSLVPEERAFLQEVRQQVLLNRFYGWFADGGVVSERALAWYAAFLLQQREVSYVDYPLSDFEEAEEIPDAELIAYYEENLRDYVEPERGRAEYVSLTLDDLLDDVPDPTDEEIGQAHADLVAASGEQERRVSHILLASAEDAARIAADARADPGRFADLAAEFSEDAGSALNGGDLGFVAAGDLDPSLEDALWALEVGEVSDPVESEFGTHILLFTEFRAGEEVAPLEEMREELADRLRRESATAEFAALAEEISERLYVEVDRLAPVAEEYGLEVLETDWLSRDVPAGGEEGNAPPFDDEQLLATLFSPVHREGESTEMIPLDDDAYVAARMAEYSPVRQMEYEEVADEVRESLAEAKALERAVEKVREDVDKLREGEALPLLWSPTFEFDLVGDGAPEEFSARDLESVRRIDPSEGFPAYAFTLADDALRVIRVERVVQVPPEEEEAAEQARENASIARGNVERLGYLEHLSGEVPIVIRTEE